MKVFNKDIQLPDWLSAIPFAGAKKKSPIDLGDLYGGSGSGVGATKIPGGAKRTPTTDISLAAACLDGVPLVVGGQIHYPDLKQAFESLPTIWGRQFMIGPTQEPPAGERYHNAGPEMAALTQAACAELLGVDLTNTKTGNQMSGPDAVDGFVNLAFAGATTDAPAQLLGKLFGQLGPGVDAYKLCTYSTRALAFGGGGMGFQAKTMHVLEVQDKDKRHFAFVLGSPQ